MSEDTNNILEMSDEEAMNQPLPDDTIETSTEEVTQDTSTESTNTSDVVGTNEEVSEKEIEEITPEKADNTFTEESTDSKAKEEPESVTPDDKEVKEESSELDYKAEYAKLMAPFRANGKDMQIHNVEDALTLMKQGANYNKKMSGLKPNLKLMKMLANNELLDEAKLTYLIDLSKKNPEAVQKLIKDSGIDPLDIDTEKETEYSPSTYTVDDTEVELDAVLDEIRDTQSFNETIDVISNKWDASSKKVLLKEPSIISVINEHVGNGIYGQITSVIENERMLGRLQGLSDLEAYKKVGDAIQAVGGFANQQKEPKQTEQAEPTKSHDDPKLKNQKRAASSTKGKVTAPKKEDFNPLNMSDEEFEKAVAGQLY